MEIEEKVKLARQTEIQIAKAREVYRPVASRGSLVYFLIDNLNALDRVYHYSMANFVAILKKGMGMTPGAQGGARDTAPSHLHGPSRPEPGPSPPPTHAPAHTAACTLMSTQNILTAPPPHTHPQNTHTLPRPVFPTHRPCRCPPVCSASRLPAPPPRPRAGGRDESKVPMVERLGQEVELDKRVELLVGHTTFVLIAYVAQGLFERHKLIVATQVRACVGMRGARAAARARGRLGPKGLDGVQHGLTHTPQLTHPQDPVARPSLRMTTTTTPNPRMIA